MARKVVITGLGSLSTLGSSASELWQSIMDKKVAYKAVPQADPKIKAKFFALLDEDSHRLDGFSKRNTKGLPLFARNALYSARQALRQAFGDDFAIEQLGDPFRRGVIMGTGWGGYDEGNANCMDYHRTSNASSFSTIQNMGSVATAAVTMSWAFRGYQNTTVAACASGSIAIGDAFNVIRRGDADLMLAGGSESLKDTFNIWSIDIIGALSQEQSDIRKACCPFSMDRNGFILAEGASCVVLEDLESARKRGATILGEVVGYGNFSDAANLTAPAADLLARVHCIKQCLTQAEIEPDQIDYINAHGTSTQLNDLNETQSLKAALGNAAYEIPISSTKSYTGHQIGAAGAVETAICMKAFEHRTLPGTLHLDNPDPACDLNYLPNEHHRPERLNYALNLSFGFGGTNSVLLFKNARD
ncbi:MAG TPA: beta-ketoacyl-[acyl-carrier-protein] synthase family protein [Kofleriaceae bacterium]|nr:beta-ketoacyl-[acyl-carrier-protein] synthase family protein [Kofleriaceae bacterium]